MVVNKWLPHYMHVFNSNLTLKDCVNMSVFVFKETMKRNDVSYDYLNIYGRHKMYRGYFLTMVTSLAQIVYYADPEIRLGKQDVMKLFLDYYNALHEGYGRRGFIFNLKQVSSLYSIEIFQRWASKNFISMNRYIQMAFSDGDNYKKIKKKEPKIVELKSKEYEKITESLNLFKKSKAGIDELTF